MYIPATDGKDNTWDKRLKLRTGSEGTIVSLGAPYEWYLADLKKDPPKENRLYIDAMGRNHRGAPVWVYYSELMSLVKTLIKARP